MPSAKRLPRVLLLATSYPPWTKGGGEISTQLLAEGLVARGHDVTVLAAFDRNCDEEVRGVRVLRRRSPNIYWSYGKKRPFPARVAWHLVESWNFHARRLVQETIAEVRPDIVHSSTIEDLSPYAWQVARDMGVPVVHTLRSHALLCARATMFSKGANCQPRCSSCRVLTAGRQLWSQAPSAVVGISRYILHEHLSAGYFARVQTRRVIPNSVSPVPQTDRPPSHDRIRLGFVGRLEGFKGIELLLEAHRAATRTAPNRIFELHVFGEGADPSRRKELERRWSGEHVFFKGHQPAERIYQQVDVLVAPSLHHEAFGRTVPEAYSYGLPVITSNRGGLPEMVLPGKTGLVFDPDVPRALTDAILSLTPARVRTMGEAARQQAAAYSIERVADDYASLYQALLGAEGRKDERTTQDRNS